MTNILIQSLGSWLLCDEFILTTKTILFLNVLFFLNISENIKFKLTNELFSAIDYTVSQVH